MKKALWMKGIVLFLIMMVTLAGTTFAQQGKYDLILKLKDIIIEIQNQGELGFRNFTLCSKIITMGHYVALPEPKVKVGTEELLIYIEPANVFTSTQEGRYEIWITQDMFLLDEEGELLLEKTDAISAHFNTATPMLDLYLPNTLYNMSTLPVGEYTYKAVLHDVLRGTTATKTIDFEVVE